MAPAGLSPGNRALHAKGKLYRGTFTATAEAAQLSRAAHLSGSAVPALIRFSNGIRQSGGSETTRPEYAGWR